MNLKGGKMDGIKLVQSKEQHFYETPIGILPSSTTILSLLSKPALMHWAVKQTVVYLGAKLDEIREGALELTEENASQILKEAREYHQQLKDEAMDIGSQVHHLIEQYLLGNPYEHLINEKTERPFEAFLEWQKEREFRLVKAEHSVWSKKKYAGTLDCVAYLNDKLYIIDFKTSNAIYPEYLLQLASYWKAYEEMSGQKVKRLGILRLDKETGMPEWVEFNKKEANKAFRMFMYLVKFWWIKKGGDRNG